MMGLVDLLENTYVGELLDDLVGDVLGRTTMKIEKCHRRNIEPK